MTSDEVIRLLRIEHACSQANCDRKCDRCEIVQEQSTLDEMYKRAIQLIEENAELKAHCKAVDEVNEKMKCCGNCSHYSYIHFKFKCNLSDAKQFNCHTKGKMHWELAE